MMTIVGFTVAVNIVATAKELVVAQKFGTNDALDAFLIAFLLPSVAINIVTGSFNSALIPTFIKVRQEEGSETAQRLFSSVLLWSTTILFMVSLLLILTASFILPILGSGFNPEKQGLTRSLFFILVPILFINGLSKTWTAFLNANERFALAAISPMLIPLLTMTLLLLLSKTWGIYALAAGTVSGFLLEAGLLAWGISRQGFHLILRWYSFEPALKNVTKQYIPVAVGALLMSSTILIDQSMAAMLAPGSVSALNYGNKIVALLLGIGSLSFGTAIFPHFSRMVAIGDWKTIRKTFKTYAYLILLLTGPLVLCLIYLSETLVQYLFERGAFTSADTNLVSHIQIFFSLQIPFYFWGILIARLISSINANNILMQAALINLSLKVIFNYVLMQRLGVAGIALSTAAVYLVSVIYCSIMLNKRISILEQSWKL
jgi:putative peptidoglycan lipid II flippase